MGEGRAWSGERAVDEGRAWSGERAVDEGRASGEGWGSARAFPALHERPWAVGVYLAFAALVGLAWSAPLAAALGAATGAYPRGDAELFDPGGVMLLEALRHLRASMAAVGASWAVLAVAAAPLGVVVLAFCVAQLGARGPARASWALARAVSAAPTLVVVGAVALIAQALLATFVLVGGGPIVRSSWPEPPARDIARWGLTAFALALAWAAGVVHDLARVAAVTGPVKTYAALRAALRTAWRAPAGVAWSSTWRAAVGLGAAVGAAWLGIRIGRAAPGAVLAMALVHQVGLAAMGWMRLSWLARAVRLVAPEVAARPPAVESGATVGEGGGGAALPAVAGTGVGSAAASGGAAPVAAAAAAGTCVGSAAAPAAPGGGASGTPLPLQN